MIFIRRIKRENQLFYKNHPEFAKNNNDDNNNENGDDNDHENDDEEDGNGDNDDDSDESKQNKEDNDKKDTKKTKKKDKKESKKHTDDISSDPELDALSEQSQMDLDKTHKLGGKRTLSQDSNEENKNVLQPSSKRKRITKASIIPRLGTDEFKYSVYFIFKSKIFFDSFSFFNLNK